MSDAVVLDVPVGVQSSSPLQVLFLSTAGRESPIAIHPRLLVRVGNDASVSLKQSYASVDIVSGHQGEALPSLVNCNTNIVLGNRASLRHTYSQELGDEVRHCEVLTADIGSNSLYQIDMIQLGATISRLNLHVDLQQSNSNFTVSDSSLLI